MLTLKRRSKGELFWFFALPLAPVRSFLAYIARSILAYMAGAAERGALEGVNKIKEAIDRMNVDIEKAEQG
jgi:hypothetical protein